MTYNPNLGTFLERDPIEAGQNLYQYVHSNPVTRVDPFGLREANIGPSSCLGEADWADKINALVREKLKKAFDRSWAKDTSGKWSDVGMKPFDWAVWQELAGNEGSADTHIEKLLYALTGKKPDIKGYAPGIIVGKIAVGTDKIGHFFQQGYMVWSASDMFERHLRTFKGVAKWPDNIIAAKTERFARAFSMWTEGLYNEEGAKKTGEKEWSILSRDPLIADFMKRGQFPIPEHIKMDWKGVVVGQTEIPALVDIAKMERMYGGRELVRRDFIKQLGLYPLEASAADHAANLSGAAMWKELMAAAGRPETLLNYINKWDIRKWVTADWQDNHDMPCSE
jgi:hypothetical protein